MATDTYSDLSYEYRRDLKTRDVQKDTDLEAIKNSVRNILMTKKTERRMLPEFGASLEQLLFEPIDKYTAQKIGSVIFEELQYWEPRIIIKTVFVEADEDNNQYEINIEYSIKSATINTSKISFVLQQG